MKQEPKLCPDCPLKGWIPEVKQRLKDKQMTRIKDDPSNLRICMELRKLAKEYRFGPPWTCQYYPESEDMQFFT